MTTEAKWVPFDCVGCEKAEACKRLYPFDEVCLKDAEIRQKRSEIN